MKPIQSLIICALAAIPIVLPVPAWASGDIAKPDHLDCAGNYSALSLALPYLPGVFLMFKIAPRSGYAQNIYVREVKPISKRAVRIEANRRKREIMAAFEAGEITLQDIVAKVHACDAYYGLDPAPTTLDDLLRYE